MSPLLHANIILFIILLIGNIMVWKTNTKVQKCNEEIQKKNKEIQKIHKETMDNFKKLALYERTYTHAEVNDELDIGNGLD